MPKIRKPSTDMLWPFAALAGYIFFISLMPISPNDFWWHLKIGELIHLNGEIPTTNIFAWTLPANHPYFYAAWLSEYLFYLLYLVGKIELVMFARNILVLIVFLLWMVETYRQSRSWRLTTLTVIIGGGMIFNNLSMRPQLWSVLAFILGATIINRYRDGQLRSRWLVLYPLIILFWVNLHGAFMLGVVFVGIVCFGELMRTLFKQAGYLPRQKVGALMLTGLATILATLINPRGANIWNYVLRMSSSIDIRELNSEWQPPSPEGFAAILFFASILIFMIVLYYSNYRPTFTDLLLVLCFLWLAWTAGRHIIWYAIIVVPLLVRGIQQLPVKLPQFSSQRNWLNLVVLLLLFVPAFLVQPWWIERFPLPDTYWKVIYKGEAIGPLVGKENPIEAVEFLRDHPGGNLFHDAHYGSFLIWALPDQGVFIDARVELYPRDLWDDYSNISDGIRSEELLAKYRADRILLDIEEQPELLLVLENNSRWFLEYQDERTMIWKQASLSE